MNVFVGSTGDRLCPVASSTVAYMMAGMWVLLHINGETFDKGSGMLDN